ncbi:ABC transporter substrate-binding protein [Mycoplasma phocoenae]|uniref:ABC transporter substrate-binding protein n=1 Tax=Mycoplasma phocoenae TaxID=754517 RepID=A0A858U685_9MOLU|nr:ABC transporter substrate-binding protein [Mycoplasma phocoenae]QJG66775.1 ABC transporter substrate-binding protein [Mycoplasma phocoenae]
MNKKRKFLLAMSLTPTLAIAPLAISCTNTTGYDLGLATQPINTLNYVKFATADKILPSLVESPLKSAPSPQLRIRLGLPDIPMGIFGIDETATSMESYLSNNDPATKPSTTTYPLEKMGSTTGTLTSIGSKIQPVSAILTPAQSVLSIHARLNNGDSTWSNGDEVNADDYIDFMHYVLDLNTGSQKVVNTLQKKFKASRELVEAQQNYIRKHKKSYQNPFAYPELVKNKFGTYEYNVTDPNYSPWASQNPNDEKEVAEIKKHALDLGFYSGRLYWNYSNKDVLAAIPYSPDFNPNDELTVLMLPNPEYNNDSTQPKRIATVVRKYLFKDPRQTLSTKIEEELIKSKTLKNQLENNEKHKKLPANLLDLTQKDLDEYTRDVNLLYKGKEVLNNNFILKLDTIDYVTRRVLAIDEYSLRVEYSSYEPTSVGGAYTDLNSTLLPINRKFVESIGGITQFGLDSDKFLTNGSFNITDLVLGPQGYINLEKNLKYYSSDKTISNKIKIYFSADENINATMFSDKIIAATTIPAVRQLGYWTDPKTRDFMKKSSGYGTIALGFNLDKETNEKSYINDIDLRSAIYYAIDRNAMLNIVGWNSSYPVITFTAFGRASSTFGDPVEAAFAHDYMYTRIEEKELDKTKTKHIPLQNYDHLEHSSKEFKFEHVDRTDKAFRLDIARAYMKKFKDKNPNLHSVTLRYISNSTPEQNNAGLALSDFMKKAFGDYLKIETKGLPENVYEEFRTTGEYDLIYRNFDTFGSDSYSYVIPFFKTDAINKENQKSTGFRNNPTGSWTYEKYFKSLGYYLENDKIKNDSDAGEIRRKQLRIGGEDTSVWDKIIELSFKKQNESLNDFEKRYLSFFTGQYTKEEREQKWTERKSFALIAALEKIIRDAAPVVPLMEVDTYWEISRVNGAPSLYSFSLQFAYDVFKPPRKNLPTTKE